MSVYSPKLQQGRAEGGCALSHGRLSQKVSAGHREAKLPLLESGEVCKYLADQEAAVE